jgi:NTE family protein
MGIGAKMEYYRVSTNIKNLNTDEHFEDYYFTYYAFINVDSHDKAYYPKKGFSLYGEYKLITNNGYTLDGNEKPGSVAYLRAQQAIAINSRLTLYPKFFGRVVWGRDIPQVFQTYTGGQDQTNYFDIQIPFVGLRRMEIASSNSFIFRADIQYELFKNNYIILKPNIGKVVEDINSALTKGRWIKGIGITYSYNSLVGPMEVTFALSDVETRVRGFINLGYWF